MPTLLQMSLSGGITICAVLLLRFLFQNRLDRRVILAMWGLVLIQLLLPLRFSAPTSVYNLPIFRQEAEIQPASVSDNRPVEAVVGVPSGTPAAQSVSVAEPVPFSLTAEQAATLIWAAGALTCAGIFVGGHAAARRRYRFSVPAAGIAQTGHAQIRVLDGLVSPLTYGIFHPVILLPPDMALQGGDMLRFALAHEMTHVKRWDVLKKAVLLLAAAVHWFNPLVWVMVYTAGRDIEMACDAAVIRSLGEAEKIPYARTLISMEEAKLHGVLMAGFSSGSTESRLKAIVRTGTHPIFSRMLAAVLVGTLLVCFLPGQTSASALAPEATPPAETEPIITTPSIPKAPLPTVPNQQETPIPDETDPEEPLPEIEILKEAIPENPEPEEPAYTEPQPTAPAAPEPIKPAPAEPEPTESEPTEPEPTEPEPTEPEPTEPEPTEPEPTEPEPTEPEPTEPEPEPPYSGPSSGSSSSQGGNLPFLPSPRSPFGDEGTLLPIGMP